MTLIVPPVTWPVTDFLDLLRDGEWVLCNCLLDGELGDALLVEEIVIVFSVVLGTPGVDGVGAIFAEGVSFSALAFLAEEVMLSAGDLSFSHILPKNDLDLLGVVISSLPLPRV